MPNQPIDVAEWLYRRSYSTPEKKYMNPDGTATSRVFKLREKDNGQLSVDIRSLTSVEDSLGDWTKFILFELPNEKVMALGLESFHDEQPDNKSHGFIWGLSIEDDIMPGKLARISKRVHIPPSILTLAH